MHYAIFLHFTRVPMPSLHKPYAIRDLCIILVCIMNNSTVFLPVVGLRSSRVPRPPAAHLYESYPDPAIVHRRLTILVGLLSRAPNLDPHRPSRHALAESGRPCAAMGHRRARHRCVCS